MSARWKWNTRTDILQSVKFSPSTPAKLNVVLTLFYPFPPFFSHSVFRPFFVLVAIDIFPTSPLHIRSASFSLRPQFAIRIATAWPLEIFSHNKCWRCALYWVISYLVVWVITPCSLLDGYLPFGVMSCIFLRDASKPFQFLVSLCFYCKILG
jgi:hypothetical protein